VRERVVTANKYGYILYYCVLCVIIINEQSLYYYHQHISIEWFLVARVASCSTHSS